MIINLLFGLFNSYVLSFSLGAGPVPALLLPEIFASRIRAKAVALSLGMHWVSDKEKGSVRKYYVCIFSFLIYTFVAEQLSAVLCGSLI